MKIDQGYLDQIIEQLSGQVQEILDNDVAPKAEKVQRRKIKEVVYDAYEPDEDDKNSYKRRKNQTGGLLWGVTSSSNRTKSHYESEVSIYNKAEANMNSDNATFKDLPWLIEYGHKSDGLLYDYPYNKSKTAKKFTQARPFMEETYKEIDSSGLVEKTLKRGLKKFGYKVK